MAAQLAGIRGSRASPRASKTRPRSKRHSQVLSHFVFVIVFPRFRVFSEGKKNRTLDYFSIEFLGDSSNFFQGIQQFFSGRPQVRLPITEVDLTSPSSVGASSADPEACAECKRCIRDVCVRIFLGIKLFV